MDQAQQNPGGHSRRGILSRAPFLLMAGALAASYGTLLTYMARFLYPARGRRTQWVYVTRLASLRPGDTLLFKAPAGQTVNITRKGNGTAAGDFTALSSVCPHLGCQVHWEPQNDRYFCPCHNGAFRPDGVAYEGPPADAGQTLSSYPLRSDAGLLYMEVPTERLPVGLAAAEPRGRRGERIDLAGIKRGPGHDPCLAASPETAETARGRG